MGEEKRKNDPNSVRGDESVDELLEKIALSDEKIKPMIFSMISMTIGMSSPATFRLFKEKIRDLEPELYEKVKEIAIDTPKYSPPPDTSSNSGCFIATATMGDYNHPVVLDLRNFRDQFLLKSLFGRVFVKIYYLFSPPIAKLISKSELSKSVSFKLLIQPLHKLVKRIEE